jgi:phenylacetate-coenzyme A ligase PaaK-like adenylate-forming protein
MDSMIMDRGADVRLDRPDVRERVQRLAAVMLAREHWPKERLKAYQQERLRSLVRHAVGACSYYREAIGSDPDGDFNLNELPVLTKETLAAEFDGIVTDRRVTLAGAEEHLASARAAEPLFGEYRVVGSGGTSGQRSIAVYDQIAWEISLAAVLRLMAVQEISPDARVIGIGAPTPLHMTNRIFSELRAGRPGAPRLAVTTPIAEVVDALNAYRPEVIITYPSFIRRLAEEQQAGHLHVSPGKVCSVAETLTQDVRALAYETWGAIVLNGYGATEVNVIAAECPWRTGLHVFDDLLIVEVVDEKNRPVPAGRIGHKVLVTNLFNRALPLIRYELADLATVNFSPCPCGRTHLRLGSLKGRREDMLTLPARNGGEVSVDASLLGETLLHIPAVRQYQLGRRPDRLAVRVVLRDASETDNALRSARQAIEAELLRLNAAVPPLTVEAVEQIERTGTGAKHRLVSMAS